MVMAVNPGFAGQKMVDSHLDKLTRIKKIIESSERNIDIVIDGNTTPENGREMVKAGATGLVVGTSSLLKNNEEFINKYDDYVSYVSSLEE